MNIFERWCALHGEKPYGANNETVARFVSDIAPMGIEQVWEALQEISRAHYVHLLPDPTVGETVTTALNNICRVNFPRSWPKNLHDRFNMLPHEIQHWLARRQAADDALIQKLQREHAQLKKEHEHADKAAGTDRSADATAELASAH
jgi:uncharacterized protein YdcH (DUF465 family)